MILLSPRRCCSQAANFLELHQCEVRRILLPRTPVNRASESRNRKTLPLCLLSRYGSLGSMQKNYLVPLHLPYLPAGGPCGGATQLVRILLALVHGLFTLPEGHQLHLAALAVGEGENGVEALHLGERRRQPLGGDAPQLVHLLGKTFQLAHSGVHGSLCAPSRLARQFASPRCRLHKHDAIARSPAHRQIAWEQLPRTPSRRTSQYSTSTHSGE